MNPVEPENADASHQALVEKSLGGDSEAFRMLVTAYRSYGYALAYRTLRSAEEAKDVLQEAWMRVWKHRARYRTGERFSTWFYAIVVNICYDRIRSSRRRTAWNRTRETDDLSGVSDGTDLHAELAARDQCVLILDAAKRLPPMQRLVFQLRDVEDFSIAEVSEIVGISVASVKTNLCYARKRIREAMAALKASEAS